MKLKFIKFNFVTLLATLYNIVMNILILIGVSAYQIGWEMCIEKQVYTYKDASDDLFSSSINW